MATQGFVGSAHLEGIGGRYDDRKSHFEINRNLNDHLKDMGVSMQFMGRDLMRTYCNNLLRLTWPKSKKEGSTALKQDLYKIFTVLDDRNVIEYFDDEFGDGATTKGGVVKGKKRKAIVQRTLENVEFNWQGDQSQMHARHQRTRNRRGRISRWPREIKTIGEWRFFNTMYVPRTAMRKYLRTMKARIALCKAGWAPAVKYFARITGGRMVLPAFVANQARQSGSYQDVFKPDGSGWATATNLVPWSSRLTGWIINAAQANAENYMAQATRRQAEKIAERFNNLK